MIKEISLVAHSPYTLPPRPRGISTHVLCCTDWTKNKWPLKFRSATYIVFSSSCPYSEVSGTRYTNALCGNKREWPQFVSNEVNSPIYKIVLICWVGGLCMWQNGLSKAICFLFNPHSIPSPANRPSYYRIIKCELLRWLVAWSPTSTRGNRQLAHGRNAR